MTLMVNSARMTNTTLEVIRRVVIVSLINSGYYSGSSFSE
nr:MAG TPA_asm: hypothetical protein [Caudoviricetes sp.]DAM11640.1 MAG TPA: hypothetical protein [Caudoviricetes sp.]